MSITQAMTTSFKAEINDGIHAFGTSVVRASTTPDVFKIALYSSSAALSAATTAYTTTGEITGTGYSAGGQTLSVSVAPTTSGTTAYWSFSNPSWSGASFTARGALIYNSSQGNRSVAVLDFGSNKTCSSQTFTIQMPTADSTSAILRIV